MKFDRVKMELFMLRIVIYFLIFVSIVICIPSFYQQYMIWDASNPLDDDSVINQWLFPITPTVSSSVVMRDIKEGREPVVIDVRTKEEYDKGHIPGAISIPEQDLHKLRLPDYIDRQVPEKLKNKRQTIYIYCNFEGYSGAVATRLLQNMSYFNAFNIEGGLEGWEESGFEVEDTLF